jgi:virginiamycin B lyase
MANGSRNSCPLALGLAAAVWLSGWPLSLGAQTITEFPIQGAPNASGLPQGITTGPDGALWFALLGSIGRVTPSGVFTFYSPVPANGGPVTSNGGITTGSDGALWFTEGAPPGGKIGRITTSGAVAGFSTSAGVGGVGSIAAGPDGALWFTEGNAGKIGRITTSGSITEYPLPVASSLPFAITAGPDGALWFTEHGAAPKIGRITTSGGITEYPILGAGPDGITAGPDGALWFIEEVAAKIEGGAIGRITTAGTVAEFPISNPASNPRGIAAGPDGALWFTDIGTNSVGRATTSGMITEFTLPSRGSFPIGITAGPDGAMWFTESQAAPQKIGRITTGNGSGLVAAVLPSSRSVEVGNTATAFATVINSSSSAASGCAIVPVTPVPASFVYQTTNPATNALTGPPNTPVSIAAGGSQSFVIAFTPNSPFVPTNVVFGFSCTGVSAAPSTTGLNTLLLSASTTPVPDVVALAATAMNDGILHIPGTSGSGAFAVATVNVGAGASITATANTGAASLPLAISLCQTDPASGQCTSSIGPNVTTTINANATPTFAIFATASGAVPFVPQTNRIFVEFSDANGVVRGSTSVAVETQ